MNCWKCRAPFAVYPDKKVPFKAICDKCTAWQHCCKNCKYYKPGMANDCLIPGTEYVADREAANFCEEYKWRDFSPESPCVNPGSVSKKLFGEEDSINTSEDPKDKFRNLFGD